MDFIPKTADGEAIHPGMEVWLCSPYSTVKAFKVTVYSIHGDDGKPSSCNNYDCAIKENRYFDGENWQDGNFEHVSRLYHNKNKCLEAAKLKEPTK